LIKLLCININILVETEILIRHSKKVNKPFFLMEKSLGKKGFCFAKQKPFFGKEKPWERKFFASLLLKGCWEKESECSMFSEKLSRIYTGLEERYYALLDFLDARGLPVYKYNDFLESKGMPAFPITIALIVLIIAAIYGIFFIGNMINPSVTISFQDQFNETVAGVQVSVKDAAGKAVVSPKTIASGESIQLQGIAIGSKLVVSASKEGYDTAEEEVTVVKEKIPLSMQLKKQIKEIAVDLQAVDSETGDAVKGAAIQLEWQGVTRTGTTDAAGKAHFTGIPEDMPVTVKVQADGYEQVNTTKSFVENELATIELSADTAALAGITKLIVSVEDEQGTPIEGAKITIMDKSNDTVIAERTIAESEALFDVTGGTSVRLIVQKDGFLRYDSLQTGESRTLRLLEEEWPVILLKGGNKLSVIVVAGQFPLSDATVQLFDLNSNLIESATTDFAAEAEFSNLQPEQYFVTAHKLGFLPAREQVNIAETETVTINLRTADLNNSAYLGISVFDSYNAAANNADLFFFEKVAGEELPLGIPPMKTDITGYAAVKPAISSTVVVHAKKDLQEGSGEKLIEANKENQMVIELSKPVSVVELQIVDKDGLPVSGTALIETVSGELLFDGNITDGRVYFDGMGNKEINLTVTTDDGQTFSQQVDIDGKETVKVTLGKPSDELAPTVNFLGIFNENDELVEGITPANFYWAKFEINWPSGLSKGGFHARIGSDDSAFVDSQPAGIVGFDATTGSYFFGKSFQPLPLPGNEAADKQNTGSAGQFNKFVELYFTQPQNTTVVRVKIKARESITADSIELHFRAWSEAGSKFYRQPADAELGNELFSSSKTALYAETIDETINVFSSDAVCEKELCASYLFVLPNGLFVERQQFKPMTEELYALEIDLKAGKALDATIKLDTDKANPLLYFTGYEVDNFLDQPQAATVEALPSQTDLSGQGYIDWAAGDATAQTSSNPLGFKAGEGSTETSITFTVSIAEGQERKVRIYFKPFAAGKASIKSQVVAEAVVLNEEFNFNIEQQKFLLLSVSPEEVSVGQDFTITAMDKDNGDAVQNVVIHLQDSKGKDAAVIVGSGATRKGLQGEYFFKNSFNPGIYKAVASAAGYATAELEIVIARDNLLSIKSPITINIAKGESSKSVTAALRNTAKEEINAISYELEKEADFPEEFAVSAEIPPAIGAGKDAVASISVNLELGEESSESLYGEADLVIKGMAAGNYPTKTKAKLIINYNKQLDADCLKFNTQEVLIRLIGTAGSSASEEVEIENTCETGLSLSVKVKEQEPDPNLSVTVQNLQIEKDATEKMLITASNRIDRLYSMQERRHFTIALESPQLAKSIQLTVELWNPSFNLSYPPTLALWLARAAAEESAYSQMPLQPATGMAYAQAPLQIMNNGFAPITAFRAAVEDTAYRHFGITADIRPYAIQGINLQANQALSPMRYVYAETSKAEALKEPAQGYIYFTGVVMGHQYPDLGRTMVSVNYTGTQCLKASAVQSMVFSAKKAETILEKEIKLKNECGEQIRIIGTVKPAKVAGNQFMLFPANVTLAPGQESNFALRLIGSQEMERTVKLRAIGLLVMQNKFIESNDLDATLKLGELIATAEGKGTEKISIKNCSDAANPKQLSFPILSSDCSQGYCDAKQLAAYLISKADNLVKIAKDKAAMARQQAAKFSSCAMPDRMHCTFDEMGLTIETFPVFLQLDFLDNGTLSQELKEKSKTELRDYGIELQRVNLQDISGVGFRFKNIYLSGAFKGCGKYYVQINGAVQVINGELMSEGSGNTVISISIEQDRADTDQCKPYLIENAANFLPVDEGYNINSAYRPWPGFAEGSAEFGELPKLFAKELFKKEEGRYSASTPSNSNKLVIVKGGTGNGLLKIRIEKTGSATEPKKVFAHIGEEFAAANKEMPSTLSNALSAFMSHSFGEEDCWGEDDTGQYIVMKSGKNLKTLYGAMLISGDNELRINTQLQCADFNVESKLLESVQFSTDFLLEGKPRTGIEYVKIFKKEEYAQKGEAATALLEEKANEQKSKKSTEVQLKDTSVKAAFAAAEKTGGGSNQPASVPPKETGNAPASTGSTGKLYRGNFVFCVKGSNEFALAPAAVKSISITAESVTYKESSRKTDPGHSIALQVCGIHPKELLKKIVEREKAMPNNSEETYFAMPGWKGKPDPKMDLSHFGKLYALEEEIAQQGPAAVGQPISGLSSYEKKMRPKRIASLGAYLTGCAPVAFFSRWGNPLFDCVLPIVPAAMDLFDSGKQVKEWIVDTVGKVLGPIGETAGKIVNGISRALGGGDLFDTTAGEATEPLITEQEAESQFATLWHSAAGFVGTKSIIEGISATEKTITLSSARTLVASNLADQLANEFVKENLKGMPQDAVNAYEKKLVEKIQEVMADELYQHWDLKRMHFTGLKKGIKGQPIDKFVMEKVMPTAFSKTKTDFEELIAKKLVQGGAFIDTEIARKASVEIMPFFDSDKISNEVTQKLFNQGIGQFEKAGPEGVKGIIAQETWTAINPEVRAKLMVKNVTEQSLATSAQGFDMSAKKTWEEVIAAANKLKGTTMIMSDGTKQTVGEGTKLVELMRTEEVAEKVGEFQGKLRLAVSNTTGKFSNTYGAKIFEAYQDEISEKLLQNAEGKFAKKKGAEMLDDYLKKGKYGKGGFFTGLAKGVLSGVAANAAGMILYGLYWKGVGPTAVETQTELKATELLNVLDDQGNVIGKKEVQTNIEIFKNQPHRIVIKKNAAGKTTVIVTPLSTQEQLREMVESFKKNPAGNWNIDCTNYATKESGFLGTLDPMLNDKIKPEFKNVYAQNDVIVRYFSEYYKDAGIDEALIMAVLLEQPEKIKGCSIEAGWWKKNLDDETRNAVIECATRRLYDVMKKNKNLSEFTTVSEKAQYVTKIQRSRTDWDSVKVPEVK
jgi:hypothetical protein